MKASAYPTELQYLLAATQFGDLAGASPLQGRQVDWDRLLFLARSHGVRPQLWEWLAKSGNRDRTPDHIIDQLERETKAIAAFNLNNAREMLRLLRKLQNAGITCIPFKGVWIADKAYGGLHRRESDDIDFFIYSDDLPKIDTLMRAEGYTDSRDGKGISPALVLRDLYDVSYDHYQGDLRLHHVEFHWRVAKRRHRLPVGLLQLEGFLREDTLQQFTVPSFSPTGHFLLLILNHGGKDGWWRLRQVLDLARLIDACGPALDWETILKKTEQWGVRKILLTGLALQNTIYGVPAPPELATLLETPPVQRLLADRRRVLLLPPESWTRLITYRHDLAYHWRSRDRLRDRLILLWYDLWQIVRPAPGELKESGLPPHLAFLLPVHRLFRLARIVLKKN